MPCATCSNTNSSQCTSCIAGYTYNSLTSTCGPQLNCNGACSVCPIGYILQNGLCTICNSTNCQICSNSNSSICLTCTFGYYLNNNTNQCNACLTSCATCLRPDGCSTCATGYTFNTLYFHQSNSYQCFPCVSPCATCVSVVNYCSSCISGYSLIGWKCVQNFNFAFNLILQTNSTTFNQNYNNFIQALASSIGSSNGNIVSISYISSESSVILLVQGSVAPTGISGSPQASSQFNSLSSALSINNTIVGLQILNSSISVTGGSINIQCNITNCLICQTVSSCSQCNGTNLFPNVIGDRCVLCNVTNCVTCSNNNVCGICANNYLPYQGLCFLCNITGCQQCQVNNICSLCNSGLQLNTQGLCVICNITNCINCISNNLCTTCVSGLSPNPSGNQCLLCNINNCISCISNNTCI